MYLSDALFERVRLPLVGLPHGVTGWRPPEERPSPPPCGWSTGFMATPRTLRTLAEPALAAGLAKLDVGIVGIGHSADGRHALSANHACLTRIQTQNRISGIAPDELHIGAGRPCDLPALALLHFHIVDDRADRRVGQRHRIAGLHVNMLTGHDRIAGRETLRRQNIAQARRPDI